MPQDILFNNGGTLIQRAIRESDGQTVILKSLVAAYPKAAQLSRFSFAYDVLNKFDHPNIIKALDYLEQDNAPVLVLEDIQGIDLRQYAKQQTDKRLPLEGFLNIAIQLADALSVIHHAHVIHKDLHPGNMIINPESQQAQIIDFGLASVLTRERPSLAAPDKLEGVLAYISPEQTGRMNRALDYRSDFYTLGVTFYELLSGQLPFSAEDALGMVHAHIAKDHKSLMKVCKDIPEVVSRIIDKLLNKVAERRYQSAQGLKQDLETCLQALKKKQDLKNFKLGKEDISERFQVPQKLYGRQTEINRLLEHFNKVADGTPQLLSICGYSGVGKSALMQEVHKPIAAHNGVFLSGKFDQFQRNIPYSAFHQILKSWLLKMLSLSENSLQRQRERINKTLGANARVLIDFMHGFQTLLGDLPEVPVLGADETQNRFHIVFLKLITLIAEDRPLVICIDDLQWADHGSLNLLPLLMREADCRLLIILAYRDNEVDAAHPAIQCLKKITDNNADCISSLSLGPLSVQHIQLLLIDSLHRPVEEVQSLAKLVHQKTGGNPFFINEFLKTLYREALLDFDLAQHRWLWDVEAINDKGITDNIVELMLDKMQQLPESTQKMLRLASCIGSRFDIGLLAIVAEQKEIQVTYVLWPALKEGLLLQDGPMYVQDSADISQCKFLHDRMLQAAYESMNPAQRQKTHLKIGRLLRNRYLGASENQPAHFALQHARSISLFDIVEQLNHGRSLMVDGVERTHLAELNQQAADQAKAASAWDAVVQYAGVGITLLPEKGWQVCYQLTFNLYHLKAEGEYLCGHPDDSDVLYDEVLKYCHEDLIKAKICVTRLVESIGRGRWELGITQGIQGLNYLGIHFSVDPKVTQGTLEKEQMLFDQYIQGRSIACIEELPEMTDQRLLVALNILSNFNACAFILGRSEFFNLSILQGLNLILRAGKSDLALITLSWYAVFLMHKGLYEQGREVAKLTLNLVQQYPQARELSSSYNVLSLMVLPFSASYSDCILQHQKGYEIGLENGEIARAAINLSNTLFLRVSKGEFLPSVFQYAKASEVLSQHKAVFTPITTHVIRLASALIEPSNKASKILDDDAFSDEYLKVVKSSIHVRHLLHFRSELAFWYGDKEKAFDSAQNVFVALSTTPKLCFYADHLVQYGLLLTAKNSANDSSSEHFELCLNKLKQLAEFCPVNFDHKYQLLLAEQGRYQNQPMAQVTTYYQQAIHSAKAQGFLQYQALGNELLALYWQSKDLGEAASAYLQEALYLYQRWGCMARVVYLKKHYGQALELPEGDEDASFSIESALPSSASAESKINSKNNSKDKSGLDFESVMKSSQLISSELKLSQLALKVMQVISESAGAQTAALVLNTKQGPFVEARVSIRSESSEGHQPDISLPLNYRSQMLDECDDLPKSVISYVLRSDEILNLSNVAENKDFENDPYLKRQSPQSILCVPVDYREQIIGALYLENRLTSKAFTESRLNVIKMLLSQTAISIENARLFKALNELNEGLEERVIARTEQLSESNVALQTANEELNAFSYSVSHDLRSPLRSMKGFSQILIEEYSDKLDTMGVNLLQRIRTGSSKMGELINGLLELSRVQSQDLDLKPVNLSVMAEEIVSELNEHTDYAPVEFTCAADINVQGDQRMLVSVMENLLNNAWKYSSKVNLAKVSFGCEQQAGKKVYFVKDNGAGFDMAKADKLFGTFQRLHKEKEFTGTGVGLATVKRIINKHKGEIWAKAEKDNGATFYFTL